MNLKEAFRYQNFLDNMMSEASAVFGSRNNFLTVTRTHKFSKANPEKEDEIEQVEREYPFSADCLLAFMVYLAEEREKLAIAIGKAKASLHFDMDAAQEANKFRQTLARTVKNVLKQSPSKRTEQGRDYKFNVEGNQMAYVYEIETEISDAYDRETAKQIVRDILTKSDEVSTDIDAAKVNTEVYYAPFFSVNSSFDEMIEAYGKEIFNKGLSYYFG